MDNGAENRLRYTRIEYLQHLWQQHRHILTEYERLKKIEIEAQKLVDNFRIMEQKQFELLGHGLKQACENWDEATSFGELVDFSRLMQALERE